MRVISSLCSLVLPMTKVLMVGQMIGSKAGTQVYVDGGYRASAGLSCGLVGMSLIILLLRGPHTKKWFGWDGGRELRKSRLNKQQVESV